MHHHQFERVYSVNVIPQLITYFTNSYFYFTWLYQRDNYRHRFNFYTALFFWSFMSITLPFGSAESSNGLGTIVLFFLLLSLLWIGTSYFIDWVSQKSDKNPEGKEIASQSLGGLLKMVLLVHLIYVVRYTFCPSTDFVEYLQIWIACLLILGLPYIVFSLHARILYYKVVLDPIPKGENHITLFGSGKEKLHYDLNSLLYIKVDDNYLEIFHADDNKVIRTVFRCTLKSVQCQLSPFPQFTRIHRSFIINCNFLEGRITDIQSMKRITIKNREWCQELPVSKNYVFIP